MYTISMNFKNATFSDTHRLIFNLLDKTNLKWNDKYVMLLYKVLSSTVHETNKKYRNKKFKTLPLTWNDKFDLPDGLYSVSDVPDYFAYIMKNMKHWLVTYQQEYIFKKLEAELHLKLRQGIVLKF